MSRQPGNDVPPDALDAIEDDETVDALDTSPEIDFDLDAGAGAIQAGTAVIRRFWTTLPSSPGVYRMFDAKGDVLYVGKAKNLKNRVGSYARGQAHTNRIARMIAETASMEFVTTATETEALLLEANLIKQLKPRFNVLMRDDKSLPYILLTADSDAPQLVKHRGARRRAGHYYGPFASVWAVNRTVNALQRAFLLRSCSDSYFENRSRPCLLYQIKRCSGPCTNEISVEDYAGLAAEARGFLSGKSNAIKERMAAEMQAASDAWEFEKAARYRDRIAALAAIQGVQGVNTQGIEEADVFALDEQAGQFCIEVFFFRNWQNWGNRAYFPKADRSMTPDEVLASFLAQFYDDKPAPRLVLVSHEIEDAELLAAALSTKSENRVEIHCPKRAERKNLVEYAARNAREALARRLADTASQGKLLAALGTSFNLAAAPRRIEVYDNSHIMGTNAVGAMIVAGPTGFMKTHYRTFTIKSEEVKPGDDYGMMREVLQRRFARLVKEHPRTKAEAGVAAAAGGPSEPEPAPDPNDTEAFPAWPDLVLIDGGRGQLEAARKALDEVGVTDVPLVGIAKGRDRDAGRETFFVPGQAPFRLPPRDPTLYFVQRLRDEAHRFAIGAHRAKRKREMVKNPLDEIPGIGPTRKRALLHHFGTVKAIERAALEDLARTPGVNAATARAVYDFFHADA
ncbi:MULTISPECIES: excinuclease ABC subunit UvrC [Methylobacterium]|uniref:UvrABC system protein C n=2 Tax=Methylobacterium TaxID=407 RepID=A0A0C6FRL4_9HYPH|nr:MULTISPECIES: excinuclease ABC subunit UvrC [Methylobacterium]MBZ6411417.1 excinuclease ABC subunit UvrC [Methylobacterium sp.]MBK3399496.1 excinuclease ABC subunit UvrC [Methylobacterium ajmalii]MBK3409337.1 excinuclease ABC subunit UvrC [Methylobacterium ajmalii]MBK3421575.1 excinuclease ABC subunit UvrC [Methylobacterium ajmalii]BAQ45355.1 excinuclease ABC subunit C [Methylobacterium aquaticum]